MEYLNFDLSIESKQDNCYKVKVEPPWAAKECLGEILFSDSVRKIVERLEESFCDDEKSVPPIDLDLIKAFGANLYEALFHGSVRDAFNLALGSVSQEEDKGLRLNLMIEPPERFLSTWDKTSITRDLDIPSFPRELKVELPLQVLVVIPEEVGADNQPLDKTGERKLVESAFKELADGGMVKLDFIEGTVSTTTINDKLNDKSYQIFHFIGHGCLSEDYGYLKLNLEDQQNCDDWNELEKLGWLRSDSFANLFNTHPSMKLVVLNSCQGAKISSTKPLAGLAPQLLRKDIPAVVAMQYPIFDDSALTFSREFYRKLCKGRQHGILDAAVINARNKLQIQRRNGLDFATPVLLMHGNGVIFDLKEESAHAGSMPLGVPLGGAVSIPPAVPLFQALSRPLVTAFKEVDETPRLKAVREARFQNIKLLRQQRESTTDDSKRIELEHHIKEEQKEVAQVDYRLMKAASASLGITGSAFAVALFLLVAAVFGVFNVVGIDDLLQERLSSVSGSSLRTMKSFGNDQVRVILLDPKNREIEGLPSQNLANDRRFHANLIDALANAGAKVIALDMFFGKENDADDELAAAIERANKSGTQVIVGVQDVTDQGEPKPPIPEKLRQPLTGKWGNIKVGIKYEFGQISLSGLYLVLRHVELGKRNTQSGLSVSEGGIPISPSLILQAIMQSNSWSAGEVPQPFFYENPNKIKLISKTGEVIREIPVVDDEMSFMLSVPSDAQFASVRSTYQEVYKRRDDSGFMSQNFRDKIVFVGYGVDSERHFVSGKREKYGVEIHANALANILEKIYLKRVPWTYNLALILLMVLIGSQLQNRYAKLSRGFHFESPTLRKFLRFPIGLLAATVLYFIVVYVVYRNTLYVVDMTYHIGALFLGYWLPGVSEILEKKKQYDLVRLDLKQQQEKEEYAVVNAT
jgi:CHASE2 domain-containing sensor protein